MVRWTWQTDCFRRNQKTPTSPSEIGITGYDNFMLTNLVHYWYHYNCGKIIRTDHALIVTRRGMSIGTMCFWPAFSLYFSDFLSRNCILKQVYNIISQQHAISTTHLWLEVEFFSVLCVSETHCLSLGLISFSIY